MWKTENGNWRWEIVSNLDWEVLKTGEAEVMSEAREACIMGVRKLLKEDLQIGN